MSFQASPGQPASVGQATYEGAGDLFTSGGLSMKAVEDTKAATQDLVNAAKSGGFRISDKGVKPMRDALLEMSNELDKLRTSTTHLTQQPQLGSHPYGHAVAAHDQKGAAEHEGSALVVLGQLSQVIQQADQALALAAGIYQKGEHQAADASKHVQV